jgi:hypothetical protein
MISFREMTPTELRHTIQVMAIDFARAAFQRLNPRAGDEAAGVWAGRNWQRFEARAIDFLALAEARREAIAAN